MIAAVGACGREAVVEEPGDKDLIFRRIPQRINDAGAGGQLALKGNRNTWLGLQLTNQPAFSNGSGHLQQMHPEPGEACPC